MYARATSEQADARRRGSALVASMVVFVLIAGLVLATTRVSSVDVAASRRSLDDVRASGLAEAGVERTKLMIADAAKQTSVVDPLLGVAALFNGASTVQLHTGQAMVAGGAEVGEYSVSMTLDSVTASAVVITITSTGYIPCAPQNLAPGEKLEAWESISVTVETALEPSEVFDNAYFINNWGWLYGSTIHVNGNARSNGQMDMGNYAPTITGSPTYDSVDWNGSAATVGERTADGALYAAWDILRAGNTQGLGGDADHQHDFEDAVTMPNLTDLTRYENRAISDGASVTVGGVTVADGVVGDDAGESQNLYLVGTAADPIVLNGPIVVRGDVVITGYVTGQGSIYSGGNVYVPDSVTYVNAPTTTRPADNSDAAYDAWLSSNWNADFLGLFARENVVVGDYTNSSWRSQVGGWLASPLNASSEDAGLDLIPNTRAGRDGVLGTADDDLLEGDGQFTVEHYSAADAAAGLIPPGFNVGDAIPGTGEDIDGDGQFDGTLTLADFDMAAPLDPTFWEGNLPPGGVANYSDISTMTANNLDATFYTNHAFSWVVNGSQPARINGSMVARNENIVYGTPTLEMNHDARLLGGADGFAGDLLPQVFVPIRVLQWRRNTEDPHRYAVTP